MGILDGKKAVVIGASGGIGRACAEKFLQEGAVVCGSYRGGEENLKALSENYGGAFHGFYLDLSDKESVAPSVKAAVKLLGGIDILINAAGITCPELIFSAKRDLWENVISGNLTGAFQTIQSVAVPMMSKKRGSIINISSVFGARGGIGQSSYCASKAGLEGLTRAAALEMAAKNVRVNCVAPGYIETAMTEGFDEEYRRKCTEKIPLKRFGKPCEVAELCAFLASDKSAYITGQTFIIDGGLSV